MDDLQSLELLSLVAKVTSELQNHLGINDKTLAEFVIAQHETCKGSVPEFKKSLEAMGAEFPNSLVESIDRLILTMHPKHKKSVINGSDNAKSDMDELDAIGKKARVFRGLAVPDRELGWHSEDDDQLGEKAIDLSKEVDRTGDDTLAAFEELASRPRQTNGNGRKRSRSPDYDRRPKKKHLSRSPSPYEEKRRRRRDSDDYDKSKNGHRHNHDSKEHHRSRRRDYENDNDFRKPQARDLDDHPELFKVYDGVVTGIKDFGAFVNIRGVKGKVDGLVHVTRAGSESQSLQNRKWEDRTLNEGSGSSHWTRLNAFSKNCIRC
jgi:ATP-dependent RNA helicase DHX8/PRP22